MKRIMICFVYFAFMIGAFGQEVKQNLPLSSEAYTAKSKAQKETGWILLGLGTAGIGAGWLLAASLNGNPGQDLEQSYYGLLLISGGMITDLVSIPFFTASARNRKRAMQAVTSIKFEEVPAWSRVASDRSNVPALSIRINF